VVLTDRHITLDDWAAQNQRSVDFLKIDTDGHDIAVLLGAERLLSEGEVLGVKIEAQFHGPIHPFANTFHNIDGFLRDHGFTLFDLNQRRYSRAALPDAFFGSRPGRTRTGQLMWGDALYLRDLAPADYERMFAFNVSSERVMKLACLFDLFDLPDCAAELLTSRADFLDADMREQLLDLLVSGAPGSYRARLAAFNSDFTSFYPDRMPAEDGEQALVGRLQERIKELTSRNAGLRDLAARRRDRIKRLTARLERTPPNQRASTIPGRFGFGSFDRWLFLPLLIPAVLILAGHSSFGFDPPGFLDSFVYVGYFWHYPEHLWVFDDNSNYKISRLPWILPGYVLHAGRTHSCVVRARIRHSRARCGRVVPAGEGVPERSRKRCDRQRGMGVLHLGSRQRRLELPGAHRQRLLPDGVLARGARRTSEVVGPHRAAGRCVLCRRGPHPSLSRRLCAVRCGALHRRVTG
jgi:hypothetical protein